MTRSDDGDANGGDRTDDELPANTAMSGDASNDASAGDLRARLDAAKWAQGDFLPIEISKHVQSYPTVNAAGVSVPEAARWIVFSHDCDIVCDEFGDEPSVELIAAAPLAQADPNKTKYRSPRVIHLDLDTSAGGAKAVELRYRNRGMVDRRILVDFAPCATYVLTPAARRHLRAFVARRYNRPVTPDDFRAGFKKTRTKLIGRLNKIDVVDQILVRLTPLELTKENSWPYRVEIVILLDDSVLALQAADRKAIQNRIRKEVFEARQGKDDEIPISGVEIYDRDDLSVRQAENLLVLEE